MTQWETIVHRIENLWQDMNGFKRKQSTKNDLKE